MNFESLDINVPDPVILSGTKNGPELWRELLRQMPTGAMIAGGAVRDWFLKVPPKDIDVFLPADSDISGLSFQFESLEGSRQLENTERAKEYAAMTEIDLVQRAVIDGLQIDAVLMNFSWKQPYDLFQKFDFGITRCGFDGALIRDTPDAHNDRENKTVTVYLHERMERARDRFERFNERMGGGWTMVIKRD